MQIPSSAGMLANSVLPVTPTQGALLSQAGETAGSTSFAPVEAVSATNQSRPTPEQRAQPDSAPENAGRPEISINKDSSSEAVVKQGDAAQSKEGDDSSASKDSPETGDQVDREARKEAQQERQQQQDLEIIRSLSQRDTEVRAHENAHSAVGGQYAGSASYTYERGPDGVNYAVGGEVPIDVGAIPGNPQATLEKMQVVQRAALAPAEPSSQDRRVAALASQQANQARAEILSESQEAVTSKDEAKADKTSDQQDQTSLKEARAKDEDQESRSKSDSENFQAFNNRVAKINEILLAISQNDTQSASGQLLDAVV